METVDPLWRPLTGASRKKKKKKVRLGGSHVGKRKNFGPLFLLNCTMEKIET